MRAGHLSDPVDGLGPAKEKAIAPGYRIAQLWYPTGLTVALLERVQQNH